MSTATTNGSSAGASDHAGPAGARRNTPSPVLDLDELVGAHPSALRDIYASGSVTDPLDLGDAPRGRLLALAPTEEIHFLVRPLVRALASGAMPWRGKVFDGMGGGANVVLGQRLGAFRHEPGASMIDGRPALLLRYDAQPWPLRAVVDELRTIGDGIAIGPALFTGSSGSSDSSGFTSVGGSARLAPSVLLWFGLSRLR